MSKRTISTLKRLSLLLAMVMSCAAHSEKSPVSVSVAGLEITQNQLKVKIDELNTKEGINEAAKAQLLPLYLSAQENLSNLDAYAFKTAEFEAAIKLAPEKTKRLQREIEQAKQRLEKKRFDDFSRISNEELEQRLILEKQKLNRLDEQIVKFEKELALQNDRPALIRQETIAAQQALETAQKQTESRLLTGSKNETEARLVLQSTLIDSLSAELKMLAAEANSNPVRIELLKAELQLLVIQKDQLSPVIAVIENTVNARRQLEAKHLENELTQAEKSASGKHSLIIKATRENIQYSRDLQSVTGKIETYTELKNRMDTTANEIEADFKSAEKKISLAGLSPVLGKILREQRRNLNNPGHFFAESDNIQNETALTSLEQFKADENLKLIADMDDRLQSLMSQQVEKSMPASDRMMIQAELRVLLDSQKELLSKLSSAYTTYLRTLGEVDFAKQQLLNKANKFASYLDERLLWVPSSAPINAEFFRGLYDSLKWLLAPSNWLALTKDVLRVSWQTPFFVLLAVLGLLIVPLLKNWAKRQLLDISGKLEKIYTDNFYHTLSALAYTLIMVLPLPIFINCLGWFLRTSSQVVNFSKAMGAGLQAVAVPIFALQFFYRLYAPEGIAVRHFHWQQSTASLLHKQIEWFRYVIIPGVFLINATSVSLLSSHSDNLGRLALIADMVALSVFFFRLSNPQSGLLKSYIKAHSNDLLAKLRYVWHPLIVCIPLIVVGFAVIGYYLSALELQQKLIVSLRLFLAIAIIYGLVIRWLMLVNRQLALKNARQKRKLALNEKQAATGTELGDELGQPIDEELIDIPKINAQTIKLLIVFIGLSLIVGLWLIWSNILPAFSFLENIVLWQHPVIVDNQETYQPITITNLLRAGLYVFLVIVSVRNFPGLIELLLFSRITVTPGSRYAINQLAQYLIVTIGFISFANELGGSWAQVQWLVAALSVGLGFGLQEIFANLVSGIIILSERPIRVGDTVTINSVSGKVSRIQMRATTIIDWDHKEHIVPNKTFITSQLVNWTLSDTTTRVVIPICIAYGSNVELAHQLMLEAAKSTPLVLTDPAPSVVFVGIKENSLEFSIMVFVSELSHRLQVTHHLHLILEKSFREKQIDLPAPPWEARKDD